MVKSTPKNLSHYAIGTGKNKPLHIEVVVNDVGKVVVFHDYPFKTQPQWYECDLDARKFFFVFDEGEMIDSGITVNDGMFKHMQNSHQVLTVLMDSESGEAQEGHYYPLLIQKA